MRVFISWSGPRSLAVAEALRDWLPNILQNVVPFLSQEDIQAGQRWREEIGTKLEQTDFGICCIDPTNQHAPWLVFEAGALAKKLDKGRVIAYLIDMQPTDLTGPLTQFQNVAYGKDGTERMIVSLNESAIKGGLAADRVHTVFEKWWPDLKEKLQDLPEESPIMPQGRPKAEKLDEILTLVRGLALSRNRTTTYDTVGSIAAELGKPLIARMEVPGYGSGICQFTVYQVGGTDKKLWQCDSIDGNIGVNDSRVYASPEEAAQALLRLIGMYTP